MPLGDLQLATMLRALDPGSRDPKKERWIAHRQQPAPRKLGGPDAYPTSDPGSVAPGAGGAQAGAPVSRGSDTSTLADALSAIAPAADRRVIALAVDAMRCAQAAHEVPAERLAVIDYSLPSTETRLWVFDVEQRKLLYAERVAHGRHSGEDLTTRFSNSPGSHQSSLGLFRTADTYIGRNGYSLRLDGLERGYNDRARNAPSSCTVRPTSGFRGARQRPPRPQLGLPGGAPRGGQAVDR